MPLHPAQSAPDTSLALADTFLYVQDAEESLRFYRDVVGLAVHTDVRDGDYRWLSLVAPADPELEIVVLAVDHLGLDTTDEDVEAMRGLMRRGLLPGLMFTCDDVDAVFARVLDAGADIVQELTDQFYGVRDCAFRDPSGNIVRIKTPLAAA